MLEFVKGYLVPGSPGFLLLGLAVGLAMLYSRRTARLGRRWLTVLVVLYVVLSLPLVSVLIQRGTLRTEPPITRAEEVSGIRTIVVLGNGVITFGPPGRELHIPGRNTTHNVLEAVRLYRLIGGGRIVASGGVPPGGGNRRAEAEVMREYLVKLGVPPQDILLEPDSTNTHEQAVNVARLLPPRERCLLVTVPPHMNRSMAVFERQGLLPVAAPSAWTGQVEGEGGYGFRHLVPDRFTLRATEAAIYERLGTVYYWVRGRLGEQAP